MVAVATKADLEKAARTIAAARKRAKNPAPALEAVAAKIKTRIDVGFRRGHSPGGRKWAPLKPATLKAKKRRNQSPKPLIGVGGERGLQGAVRVATKGRRTIVMGVTGKPASYGAVHLFGSSKRNIPARPFLPVRGRPGSVTLFKGGKMRPVVAEMKRLLASYIVGGGSGQR